MDRFDLRWPKTDACFLTDGRRCRIIWRPPGGRGPAGSIDNNVLCKERLAASLTLTPDLLGDLKSRGYPDLADEIEALAGGTLAVASDDARARVRRWLQDLPGDADWQDAGTRRGKAWIELAVVDGETVELRVPASRRRSEWVARRTPRRGGKPAFVIATDLKGIFAHLVGELSDEAMEIIDQALTACAELDHPEILDARNRWAAR